jgi:glyoxylase-like metal-dependent hydrolase (beta-lactamase superfamily II)
VSAAIHANPVELPLPGGREGASVVLHPLLSAEMLAPEAWFHAQPGPLGALRALGLGVPAQELMRIPVIAFLIEHPSAGPILIDTGFHRVVAEGSPGERNRNLGPIGRLMGRNIHMRPEQAVAAQLRARGIDPESIELVVMTHLHFDHASALADFPGATVIASAAEWAAARARGSTLLGYPTAQIDPRPSYRTIDFCGPAARAYARARAGAAGPFESAYDLLGDGSLVLVYTPGHSTGHMSVIARLREREALIAGDAIYTLATLREGRRPWRSQDGKAFERSLRALQAYDREHPDALIVPGHDMGHWQTLAERYD